MYDWWEFKAPSWYVTSKLFVHLDMEEMVYVQLAWYNNSVTQKQFEGVAYEG